jgi:hypothetical protein
MAVDAQGFPLVAFVKATGDGLFLRRYDGTAWQPVGEAELSPTWSDRFNPGSGLFGPFRWSLAATRDGRPVLAWLRESANFDAVTSRYAGYTFDLYLLRWTGTAWEELDGSASGQGVTGADDIWNENMILPGYSLTLDDNDNPIVAWQSASSGQIQIYLRRWSGSHWEEVFGSATNGGISNSSGAAYAPSVAARGGKLCVSWHSKAMSGPEILLRCADP